MNSFPSNSEIFTRAVESGGKLSVKSALNPVLWLCAIVSIPSLVTLIIYLCINREPAIWLISLFIFLISFPILLVGVGFIFLLFRDRDRLQSEEYQIQKQTLEMSQQKGEQKPTVIEATSVEVVQDTEFVQIGN